MSDLNIKINSIIPEGEDEFDMPYIDTTPMGVVETANCIRKIQYILNDNGADVNFEKYIDIQTRFVSQSACD